MKHDLTRGTPTVQYLARHARRAQNRGAAHSRFGAFVELAQVCGVSDIAELGRIVGRGLLKAFGERGMTLREYDSARVDLLHWQEERLRRNRRRMRPETDLLCAAQREHRQ